MKKTLFFFLFSLATTGLFAQTGLPTAFSDFAATPPAGWTLFQSVNPGNLTYSPGSDATPACRLDGTGEYVEIFFSDVPNQLKYYLKGTGIAPAPAFTGKFSILESVDGVSWDTLKNWTTASPPTASYVQYTSNVTSTSRYIRFFYTTKLSGSNIALDQVTLSKATLPIDINIKKGGTSVVNGSTYVTGTAASTVFKIQNLGTTSALNISSHTITGADAAMFAITGMPASVPANDTNTTFTLNFTPTGADGGKFCTVTINSNDPNDGVFVMDIYAIKGTMATEPTAQATALNFTNLKSFKFDVAFTAATPAVENYLVLIKRGSAFTSEQPVDNVTYRKGSYIGGAQIAYIGSSTNFKPNFIVANTPYYFRIFAFNGPSGFQNYLQTTPLEATITTPGGDIGNTYSAVSPHNASFVTDLHNAVKNHTQIYYSNYAPNLIYEFESRDTTNGQKVVTCAYTGYNYVYSDPFLWSGTGSYLTREHSYCFSWMPSYVGQDSIDYSDLHNLFPVEFTHANAVRSNNPLGEVVTVTSTWMGGTYGKNASGVNVYEPRDADKGDAARAIMYMSICYTGKHGQTWAIPSTQDQNVLKDWNNQDPPDNWEIARNDYIASKQGNRNPFVDSSNFACYINFSNMTYLPNPGGYCINMDVSDVSNALRGGKMYPNPANNELNVDLDVLKKQSCNIQIMDATGKTVKEFPYTATAGRNHMVINTSDMPDGAYMIRIVSSEMVMTKMMMISH